MRKVLLAVCLVGLLGGCGSVPAPVVSTATSNVNPSNVCAAVLTVQTTPAVATKLAALDPQGILGQLWAYLQSGCNNGVPVAGVSASWQSEVLTTFKAWLPQLLPSLLPLLVGIL